MVSATEVYRNRIAVVFDFDLTLAPDSFDALLRRCGVDPEPWRRERVKPLAEAGWEQILARMYRVIELSRSGTGPRITRELVEEVGRGLEPFEGVPEMFGRLRAAARSVQDDLEVEFYLLSSGFGDVHRATRIAPEFAAMWGSEFHFGEDGGVAFARQVITHPEKVRYVLQLAKGLGTRGPNEPANVWRDVPPHDYHVPLDQIVYVGDGGSDMPVFRLMRAHGGIAIAVFKSERAQDWDGHAEMTDRHRVENLARADFRPESELMRSLVLAVESIGKRIALRRLGAGE